MNVGAVSPATGEPQTVSVVICAFTTERWNQLQDAVVSVLDQEPAPEEVLVVIDYCPALEVLARDFFGADRVRVLTNSAHQGLSGARNTGTSAASGDVVVFLDDDAVAQPGWLAEHARHYLNSDVIGVGGLIVANWEEARPPWFPPEFGWVVGCSYVGQPAVTSEVRNPIGANMSFRRSLLMGVGGFSSSLGRVGTTPRGCEETELSIRVAAAFPHGRILHEPRAVVHHHVPASRGRWSYFRRRCWSEGLSKADVSRLSDPRRALAAERTYVTKVLPAGVRRNVAAAGHRRELAHLMMALTICGGLAITTVGYLTGQLLLSTKRRTRRPGSPQGGIGSSPDAERPVSRGAVSADGDGCLG